MKTKYIKDYLDKRMKKNLSLTLLKQKTLKNHFSSLKWNMCISGGGGRGEEGGGINIQTSGLFLFFKTTHLLFPIFLKKKLIIKIKR